MNSELLGSVAFVLGAALSWALDNVPVVKELFGRLSGGAKAGAVVACCVLAGGAVYLGNQELADGLLALVFALVGSQTAYVMRGG